MLLHILLHLAHKMGQVSSAPTAQRVRLGEKVAYQCPSCQNLGTATEVFREEKFGRAAGWQMASQCFECDACHSRLNAELFENDGQGILHVKTVVCAACQTPNPATRRLCVWCDRPI